MVTRLAVTAVMAGLLATALSATQSAADVPTDPSAPGYLNLHKRFPSGYEGPVEFDRSYSSGQALDRLEQMRGFLRSFRQLTAQVGPQLDEPQLRAIGNTSPETQTIGFHNIPLVIEGTVLKQEYLLAQARYELARLKHDRQEINDAELGRVTRAYQEATKKLQTFWDKKLPTD